MSSSSVPSLECRGVTRRMQSGTSQLTVLDRVDLRIEPRAASQTLTARATIATYKLKQPSQAAQPQQ